MSETKKRLSLDLDEVLYARLKDLAAVRKQSVAQVARDMLDRNLGQPLTVWPPIGATGPGTQVVRPRAIR